MNNKIKRFNDFLNEIKENHPVIEAAQTAFNTIFESTTEDAVDKLKQKVPNKFEKPEVSEESDIEPVQEEELLE